MARRRLFAYLLVSATVAALAGLSAGLYEFPEFEETIRDAPKELGQATYWFAGLMALLELSSLLGVALPFEVGIVISGAVAGEGEIALAPLLLIVWSCAAAGESVNYFTGRRFGRPFLVRHGPRFRVGPERLALLEGHFARHGRATVFFGHVIPLVRSSAPFVAGASLMPYGVFLPWSVLGNALFAGVFSGLGYAFYRSADHVANVAGTVGLIALAVLAAGGGILLLRRRRRRAELPQGAVPLEVPHHD